MIKNKNVVQPRSLWVVAGIFAALIAVLALASLRLDGWLAARWTERLATADDAQAERLLVQLAALDQAGVYGLSVGLASPRQAVVRAARKGLLDLLAEWELLPPDKAAPRLELLASHLSERAGSGSPEGRLAAAEICRRILAWPELPAGAEPMRMAVDCERVFAALEPGDQAQMAAAQVAARADRLAQVRQRRLATNARPRAVAAPRDHLLAIHERTANDEPTTTEQSGQPRTDFAVDDEQPADVVPATAAARPSEPGVASLPSEEAPRLLPEDAGDARPLETDANIPRSVRAASPLAPLSDLKTYGTVELVGLLMDDSGAVVTRAEAELARRGFTGMHLELARRLTDPDPLVRARWAQSLPGMKDLDARPWLLWLGQDPDPEVRRTALSLLATGDDPETLAAVERLARDDADPRVQQIAEKIGARRAGRKPK